MICFAMCGSFCTLKESFTQLEVLKKKGYDILPVMSENAFSTDTRFGKAADFAERFEAICQKTVIHTVKDAEPIGPKLKPDAMIICPCTGNTLAKLANGITDSAVTMAAKAQLRNGRPVVVAVSTNDGLSVSLKNIGELLCRKNIYLVPFAQDDPEGKPNSLVADFGKIPQEIEKVTQEGNMELVLTQNERIGNNRLIIHTGGGTVSDKARIAVGICGSGPDFMGNRCAVVFRVLGLVGDDIAFLQGTGIHL